MASWAVPAKVGFGLGVPVGDGAFFGDADEGVEGRADDAAVALLAVLQLDGVEREAPVDHGREEDQAEHHDGDQGDAYGAQVGDIDGVIRSGALYRRR